MEGRFLQEDSVSLDSLVEPANQPLIDKTPNFNDPNNLNIIKSKTQQEKSSMMLDDGQGGATPAVLMLDKSKMTQEEYDKHQEQIYGGN